MTYFNDAAPGTLANILPRGFYERPTLEVAQALLGQYLVHCTAEGVCAGRVVEVEAYRGPHDKAAHSYGDRRTKRTEAMYGSAGHAYIFRIYGTQVCFDVTTGPRGLPEVVLVRALEPFVGLPLMYARRHLDPTASAVHKLCSGPARLCQALGITMEHYARDLTGGGLYFASGQPVEDGDVSRGPRINITYAEEHQALPWRFWITGSPDISARPPKR